MKVKELIEQLQRMPEDMDVHIAYPYGDYWRNVVAPKVSTVRSTEVVYSGYHQTDKLADDHDYDREDEGVRQVVVIR